MNARKVFYILAILVIALPLFTGCATPTTIVETVVVTEMVEGTPQTRYIEVVVTPTPQPTEPPAEAASPFNRSEVVRQAVLADLDGLNPWYLFDITGSSYWNYVVSSSFYPTLFVVSDQRWDWVPYLAAGLPEPITQEGDFYVGTVSLKPGLKWADGSPLTAADVAFTANTALTFALSGNWPGY